MKQKKCNHCNTYKDEDEFNWRYKAQGVRNRTCRACMVNFNRNYYQGEAGKRHLRQVKERTEAAREAARNFICEYLLDHPCEMCGEDDIRVLEFHHVGEKDMTVTRMVGGGFSLKRITNEISKCQVLCANCHRRITVEERGWFRGKK